MCNALISESVLFDELIVILTVFESYDKIMIGVVPIEPKTNSAIIILL